MNFHEFRDYYQDTLDEVVQYLRFVVDETDRNLEVVSLLAQIITNHAAKWVWANKGLLKERKTEFIKALIIGFAFPLFVETYHQHFDNFGPQFLAHYKKKAPYETLEKIVLKGIGVYRELSENKSSG